MTFKFIDLFAGIGGFHYALSNAGGECVWASEWDSKAAYTYEDNHKLKPEGDITKIQAERVPEHDLLAAGFPCQAFSISGKQEGFKDPRGTLFFDIIRIVKHHNPKVVFLENVRNFASHDEGETLKTVQQTLEEAGYNFYGKLLNASDFGVPQNRQRYIMIAIRKDLDPENSFLFPEPPHTSICVEEILQSSEETSKYVISREDITYNESKFLTDKQNKPQQIGKVSKGRQGERIYDIKGHSITLSAYGGGVGAKTGLYLVDGRVRKLSPRECARLQGFPETFKLPDSDQQAWKVFGNSVPVPLIEAVAIAVKAQGFLR